jgi:Ankyrin repeats (many copies)
MCATSLIFFLMIQTPASTPPVVPPVQTVAAPHDLIEAAERGQIQKIRDFESHPGFGGKDDTGRTALLAAGEKGQKAAFTELIAILNERVKKQVALIIVQGQPAVVGGMFAVQARMSFFNSADANGMTPLMYAASHGWDEIVRALLEGGAEPSARDSDGRSAADHAEDAGYDAVAATLRNPPPQ